MATKNTSKTTKTTTRASVAINEGNPLAHYSATLKDWPVKFAGSKPTAEHFKTAHSLGARPGTKTAVAIAMYFRPEGATQGQVAVINDGAYLNKKRALVDAGHAVEVPMPTVNGHKVYKLALPTKKAGRKADKADKAATVAIPAGGKPTGRKAATKPRKAATPATTVTDQTAGDKPTE